MEWFEAVDTQVYFALVTADDAVVVLIIFEATEAANWWKLEFRSLGIVLSEFI